MSELRINSAFAEPRHLVLPGPWVGHIPFAHWLVSVLKPALLVELGAYTGNSYMSFCQALVDHSIPGQAFAVDTWEGDPQSGYYGNGIFNQFKLAHDGPYGAFSKLLKMTFDEARSMFAEGSVDLLHIDGLHTYEAVKHDFETWEATLSDRAVVLFHDTNVYTGDFGVHRYWSEISSRYPSFNFTHSNGLGVLLVGKDQPDALARLCEAQHSESAWAEARLRFQRLGATFELKGEALVLRHALADARDALERETKGGQQRHDWIAKLDADLLEQGRELAHARRTAAEARHLQDLVRQGLHQARELRQGLEAEQRQTNELRQSMVHAKFRLPQLESQVGELQQELRMHLDVIQALRNSSSWRLTSGVRWVGGMLRKSRTAVRLGLRGDWAGIASRLGRKAGLARPPAAAEASAAPSLGDFRERRAQIIACGTLRSVRTAVVLTTPHTLFVAHSIRVALEALGIAVTVATAAAEPFDAALYFVVCPQMFDELPPATKRICVQMEQSISARWFTDDYLSLLSRSLAVFDYSKLNLAFLEARDCGYPYAFHLPIGGVGDFKEAAGVQIDEKSIDVLFYGDDKTPRRQHILEALSKDFSIRIVNNVFGSELRALVASAKVVLNIHYYEKSLLETTRIYECLSLGTPVVSECAIDQDEHAGLEGAVRFVPAGDIGRLADELRQALREDPGAEAIGLACVVASTQQRFQFMLFRALLALNALSYDRFVSIADPGDCKAERIALSLPETTRRRQLFEASAPDDLSIFDGLRASPGWKGCAMSYKYLASRAHRAGLQRLLICEDDVELPPGSSQRMATVERYLDVHEGQWDIFAGLIADLHADTTVLDLQEFEGLTFVTLNRMTSMVYNIYSRRALEIIGQWNPDSDNVRTDTIDRYLEQKTSLRTVTTLPFSVGHRLEVDSSLWGLSNQAVESMIARSERLLADKVWEFRAMRALGQAVDVVESKSARRPETVG